jgi:hypothetical protein
MGKLGKLRGGERPTSAGSSLAPKSAEKPLWKGHSKHCVSPARCATRTHVFNLFAPVLLLATHKVKEESYAIRRYDC